MEALTTEQRRRRAREMVANGMSHADVARALGVTRSTVTYDVHGRPSRAGKKNGHGGDDLTEKEKFENFLIRADQGLVLAASFHHAMPKRHTQEMADAARAAAEAWSRLAQLVEEQI